MSVIKSSYPDVNIPTNVHVFDYIAQRMDAVLDVTAFIDAETDQSYTYKELRDNSLKLMQVLSNKYGVKPRQSIAICSGNCIDYPLIMLSSLAAGTAFTTINPTCTVEDFIFHINDSKAAVVFVASDNKIIQKAEQAKKRCPLLREIFTIKKSPSSSYKCVNDLLDESGGDTGHTYGSRLPADQLNPLHDIAFLLYSSGTTGKPKGVMISHYNSVSSQEQTKGVIEQNSALAQLTAPGFKQLATIPMFHIAGLFTYCLSGLTRGYCTVVMPKFEPRLFLNSIVKHNIFFLVLVPPLMLFLARHPLVDQYDLSCIKVLISGAAPLSKEVAEEVRDRLKGVLVVSQAYGMTELSPASHILPPGSNKSGSVGLLLPNTSCKVVDVDTGRTVGHNHRGELWVKGPQVMLGYLNRPDATRETIDRDGFLHTGDICYFDEEGFFYIVDRMKELIKYKGYQVAPAELESLLLTHPSVLDCGVVGAPDERAGELPIAYVTLRPGSQHQRTSVDDIVSFVKQRVAPHKYLRGGAVVVETIPKTDTGKILRRTLKQRAAADARRYEEDRRGKSKL